MEPVLYEPLVAYKPLALLVVGLVAVGSLAADKSFILEGCLKIMKKISESSNSNLFSD